MLDQATIILAANENKLSESGEEILPLHTVSHSASLPANTLSESDVSKERGHVGRSTKKEIKAVLHLPDSTQALHMFEKNG